MSRYRDVRRPATRHACRSLARAIVILIVIGLTAFGPAVRAAGAGAVTIGGPFALSASDGRTVTDRTYRGKWLLVYFGYTSCPDTCPTTLFDVASALRQLGPEADRLQALFITLDPERDTPEAMGDYVRSFDERIVGLSGTHEAVESAIQAYGAYAARRETVAEDGRYLLDHSNYLYVMDPDGRFVRAFDSDWSGERIAATLREAMARPPG